MAALIASLAIRSRKKFALAPATGQRANSIDGTAIANSPNEVRTVPSLVKAHFQFEN
jgi:hypothetical protein